MTFLSVMSNFSRKNMEMIDFTNFELFNQIFIFFKKKSKLYYYYVNKYSNYFFNIFKILILSI